MALSSQTKTDNLNEGKNEQTQGNIQNGTSESTTGGYSKQQGAMSAEQQKAQKSPNGQSANVSSGDVVEHPPQHQPQPYGEAPPMMSGPGGGPESATHAGGHIKTDDPNMLQQHQSASSMYGPPMLPHPMQQYPRYHHDPNMPPGDPFGHYRQLPPGGKPGGSGMVPPNRPGPRYMSGPPPPGPPGSLPGTPTLNSLLQSQPPPNHRGGYPPNSYDPNQQQSQQQHPGQPLTQSTQGLPPGQNYGSQGWSQPQPPRPYSPQMGPQQAYRPSPVSFKKQI